MLMAAALDLEADLRRNKAAARTSTTQNAGGANSRPQDPNRKPCKDCKKWRYIWDLCTRCGAPPLVKKGGDRSAATSAPRRRVQELVVQEAAEPEYASCDEGANIAE